MTFTARHRQLDRLWLRQGRVHASSLFIPNDMVGSEVSSFALTVFAGIAEFERGLIHQRTRNFLQA